MKKYNKGEWCEIYVFLKSLVDGKFVLIDHNEQARNTFYKINKIFKKANHDDFIKTFEPNQIDKEIYQGEMNYLFSQIISQKETTFSITQLEDFAIKEDFSLSKGSSNLKEDIKAEVEFKGNIYPEIFYSIKSKINASSTLLNASLATNFIYKVENLNQEQINYVNQIRTRTKLRDRINQIKEYNGIIKFIDVSNQVFSNNLKYIDGDLKVILAEILLCSYTTGTKNIIDLLNILEKNNSLNINLVDYPRFYQDKLLKFLFEVTFNMMPSKPIKSSLDLNFGGILYVFKDGNVFLIDNLIYKDLGNYLLQNLKLETPSTTRYNMLNIENNRFTLNLQIRFK